MRYGLFILLMPVLLCAQEKSRLDTFREQTGITVHGFLDYRYGHRLQHDDYQDDDSLNEARFQLLANKDHNGVIYQFRGDFIYNALDDDASDIDLERGEGFFDLREAYASFTPLDWMDVKAGRQILTWGTGEYLFINDLFPKDWQSFFLGRDDEYLKAPSDAVFASMFFDAVNVDVVFTPRFDADRFVTGEFLSYYNSSLGRRSGEDAIVDDDLPDEWLRDYEMAARVYRNVSGYELAAYLYDGFWKSPGGMDPQTGEAIFPDLAVIGASARGTLAGGIANAEIGYYDSRDDRSGDNPFVNNSELRWLVGYQRDLGNDINAGVQYYMEWMQDYGDYKRHLPVGAPDKEEYRQVVTLSLSKLMMNQNLRLSLFTYYSPTDNDAYLRPQVSYKYSDSVKLFIGGNWFCGNEESSFFNQFEHNSNIYAGIRYSF